ncbi:MAG: hypothetical protein WCH65_03400 [bacterium]
MNFFNDAKNKLSEEYLNDYIKFIHEEQEKNKKDEKTILKEILHEEEFYAHENNDIDK